MNEDKIIIDVPERVYEVQEIIFNGVSMPIDINRVCSITMRITAEEPFPKPI